MYSLRKKVRFKFSNILLDTDFQQADFFKWTKDTKLMTTFSLCYLAHPEWLVSGWCGGGQVRHSASESPESRRDLMRCLWPGSSVRVDT